MEQPFVVIVGAGGFGREVLQWIRDAAAAGRPVGRPRGFLDDFGPDLDGFALGIPVLGPVDPALLRPDDLCVLALGDPDTRQRLSLRLEEGGARFATVIHPSAVVAPSARLGQGVVVCPFAFIGPDAEVGGHALINVRASVGHDARIGRAAVLSPHVCVAGGVSIGDGALLGSAAVVLPRLSVGDGARVAPGAVVHSPVPAGVLALGNPASWRAPRAPVLTE
jgi:sugar O-acyltransferase (sialic acid O-acetyltransferase NeuD family)